MKRSIIRAKACAVKELHKAEKHLEAVTSQRDILGLITKCLTGLKPQKKVARPQVTVLVMEGVPTSKEVSVDNNLKIYKYDVVMETDQEELHMTDGDSVEPMKPQI